MFAARQDDVSNIHRRWSFTKINPSSYKLSFAISIASAALVAMVSHLFHLGTKIEILAFYMPLGLAAIAGAHVLDFLALHGTPVNKFSKVVHVSAFANALWALTVVFGVAADLVFSKHGDGNYILAGLLLAVGLRIGIFTSVFGARILRAVVVSFIQPLVFFFTFLGPSTYNVILSPLGLAFGFALIILGVLWEIIADRAGRPEIKSTFNVLQAFLAAWTENKVDKMEELMEEKARNRIVYTKIIKFLRDGNNGTQTTAIVLPDIHPGPFGMVGGSNLPHAINDAFSKSALVMHSVSDHSLNIPSRRELDRYISELDKAKVRERGNTCSRPVQCKIHNASATGIAFGNTAIIMLSLAPMGMEDIPQAIRGELESHGANIGFSNVLVVDCHNAMGKHLDNSDKIDLITCAKQCLDQLKNEHQQEFVIGFARLSDISNKLDQASELGQAGLATIVIGVGGSNYAIGWADSNNMENNLRDYIISRPARGIKMLEVCTSDTHSTSGKRTREGYFALGTVTRHDDIAKAYVDMSNKASERIGKSVFEFAASQSAIKVMGNKQFQDYSRALDKSMNVTKVFLGLTIVTYIAMLILS